MSQTYSAFADGARLASGPLDRIVEAVAAAGRPLSAVMVFDDSSGEPVRLNGDDDLQRLRAVHHEARAPVDIAVRVLPRHRAWLERQQGGPSAAVRRLVEAARRDPARRAEQARHAAYRFICMLAGDFAGYEDACRALFAGDLDAFRTAAADWPADIREHGLRLAEAAR